MLGRRFFSFAAALLIAMPVLAATSSPPVRPQVIKPSRFAVSVPARDLPAARPNPNETRPALWLRENERLPKADHAIDKGQHDGAVQMAPAGGSTMPPPDVSADGLSNEDTFNAFGFHVVPPDTNGAVGRDQYVQMDNLLVRVFDKTGAPLTPPFALSSLFSKLGGACALPDEGDPIVLYDALADRWLLSQFGFEDFYTAPYHECVAVSVTGDATGEYYTYDFATPGLNFPDYPKLGVWPDAYYMTVNQFLGAISFNGTGAYALEREKMLAGDPTAGMVYFDLNIASHPEGIGGTLPSTVDGTVPPSAGEPDIVSYFTADEYGDPIDGLRLFDFHVDWSDPMSSTFTERAESPIPVAAFDPILVDGTRRQIRQPAPATDLAAVDGIPDRLMFRLAYRNFGSHESMVVTHTVNVGTGHTIDTDQAAPRWYEIQRNGGAWSVVNQGSYAPDTDNRWMGSVAQDNQENLAIGYSVSSLATFPSIRYAGRLAGDPANTLGQAETSLVAGTGVQTNENPLANRWGDYSAMTVDPVDDCTFWYTQEYYTAASQASSSVGWVTRFGSFKYPSCTPPPAGTLAGQITDCDGGAPIADAVVSLGNGYTRMTDASGNYSMDLPPGDYDVTVTKGGWTAGGGMVTVQDAMMTPGDFCLNGAAIVVPDGDAAVTSESCVPANGVVDPGETVTASFCLQNTGAGGAADLVATLLPTGGVLSPSGPQDYGAKGPGASVCRDFTFTADPFLTCGESITATFQLTDGLTNLGQATFTIPTGALMAGGGQDFDGVTPPALPMDWSTSGLGSTLWETTTDSPDTPPNAAFAADDEVSIDKRLDTPIFTLTPGIGIVQAGFRNYYATEEGWDGGILEISIDGGAFTEITAAGGSFVEGGYNAYINPYANSPIAGQMAWTGDSGGYITTTVKLPASALGHDVVLRWRLIADDSTTSTGWWIDTTTVSASLCCWAPAPATLAADPPLPGSPSAIPVGVSNSNNVIEPGETFVLNPGYFNGGPAPTNQVGIFSNFTGPSGATYTIDDGTADYGQIAPGATNNCLDTTADCPMLSIDNPAVRPAQHWDTTIDEEQQLSVPTTAAPNMRTWILHVGNSFPDVPDTNGFYRFIETIFHNRITGGCGAGNYCPDNTVTRAQMAVFLLKSEHGAGYLPPACTGVFGDVACPSLFADWIEQLAAEGITAGCGGGNYCPDNPVTRAQMAVFLLKTEHGSSYLPPACAGIFGDVVCPSTFANWIEQLANEGITAGCGGGNYCPNNPNTRGQMAVFLTKTFGLVLYGP